MKEIIKQVRMYALQEIETYSLPPRILFDIAEKKALELADELHANKDVIHLGVCLMDIQLGQATKEGRSGEHVQMGLLATEAFLRNKDIDLEDHKKIINCVAAHHGDVPFTCIEAEICANADCYKFLHPKGLFAYLTILGKRYDNVSECLVQAEKKLDEKYKILSLDICKKELEPYYHTLKQYVHDALLL